MEKKMLFTPMKIGNVEIKNRVVMAPMMLGFGQINGNATEKMMNYYEERAKGGVGLIISEITRVDDLTGAASFGQLSASKDRNISSISKLTDRIHKHGAKFFVELHHPGRQNVSLMINTVPISNLFDKIMPGKTYEKLLYNNIVPIGQKLVDKNMFFKCVAPSECEPSKLVESRTRQLKIDEIEKIISEFGDAALRVKKAGVDGVELHAAHGYLIQQFLSPYTNTRDDKYGGTFYNRMRFLLDIIKYIREKCSKDFPIIVRLSVDEMYDRIGQRDRGYGLDEGLKIAKCLEENGIDAIDVSSASYDTFNYWLEPESFECGWRKNLAKAVRDEVGIPVIAANLIRSSDQAEKQLQEGIQDFIALGRPHIADPYWTNKVHDGKDDEIKRCICCLYCFESMMEGAYKGEHASCSVNPALGYEGKNLKPIKKGKSAVINGAGHDGLTDAEILEKRNFNVTVLEKNMTAGGQINLADKTPEKDKIHWCIDDLLNNALLAGAKIKYNTEATKSIIDSYKPDYVLFATGGISAVPQSLRSPYAITADEMLSLNQTPNGINICVIGSGMTGLETAYLLSKTNNVSVIEMADEIAPGVWFQHLDDIIPKLKRRGVKFYTGYRLLKIERNAIEVKDIKNNITKKMGCSLAVLALGVKSNNELYNEISKYYKHCYKIGDCNSPGRIHDATKEAYEIAVSLE